MERPNVSVKMIYENLTKLFLAYPPTISNEVLESIQILNSKNIRWGITSNTNFIGGLIIGEYIQCKIDELPDAMVFSDIIQYSKPSYQIFNRFHLDLSDRYNSYKKNEIVHIGDHPVCDYEGALNFGFQAKLIETQQDILTFVKEINND
jgi:putative hydrolase of the HAD superfamily